MRHAFGFQRTPDGSYLVFDRRAHTVWRIAATLDAARAIVTIGQEQGRIYVPSAFAVGSNGVFVVADATPQAALDRRGEVLLVWDTTAAPEAEAEAVGPPEQLMSTPRVESVPGADAGATP